jgi:hypothetical protein
MLKLEQDLNKQLEQKEKEIQRLIVENEDLKRLNEFI